MGGKSTAFGEYLLERRTAAGLTQAQVAERINVSLAYYNKVERGQLPPPSGELLDRLAEAIPADRDRLYELAGKVPGEVVGALRGRPDLWELIRKAAQCSPEEVRDLIDRL